MGTEGGTSEGGGGAGEGEGGERTAENLHLLVKHFNRQLSWQAKSTCSLYLCVRACVCMCMCVCVCVCVCVWDSGVLKGEVLAGVRRGDEER